MNKSEIQEQITEKHKQFIHLINSLSESEFLFAPELKWTGGQQLEHIILSITPLIKILRLPPFFLKIVFGKANRKSKNYEELVFKYRLKLEQGGKAPAGFIPRKVLYTEKEIAVSNLQLVLKKLSSQVSKFSEEQLDLLVIPHPLLGKLTLREMFYFTIYHVQHHHESIIRNLKS